jgi:hypothetical protein
MLSIVAMVGNLENSRLNSTLLVAWIGSISYTNGHVVYQIKYAHVVTQSGGKTDG